MNKVFEHAGDLVNSKVAHNLMRLIAEGIREDDDSADSQLRSSAVCSFLHACHCCMNSFDGLGGFFRSSKSFEAYCV